MAPEDRQKKRNEWRKLAPTYFPRWAWFRAVKGNPSKYTKTYPVYQGKRVILT